MLAATATQWVLNAVPTWLLVIGVVGGAVALALLGNWLVRRWLPRDRPWEHNDVAGALLAVVTGLYGLVLAFVIVSVWESYRSTHEAVFSEATALAQVVRDSRGFPETAKAEITERVGDYIAVVIDREWSLLAEGKEYPEADARLYDLFAGVQRFQPATPSDVTFHSEVAGALNSAVLARRQRLFASTSDGLPGPLEALILMGAVVCVSSLYFLRVPNRRAQSLMIVSVTALLTFELLLTILLSNPFSGDVSISSRPLRSGALAHLYEH
jgi:uncharacterized membrane protein YeaQ/YmgE (transglycosylase-associated protein family)